MILGKEKASHNEDKMLPSNFIHGRVMKLARVAVEYMLVKRTFSCI